MTASSSFGTEPIKLQSSRRPGFVSVEWSDGKVFELTYLELRFQCPCAACVDEMTGKRTVAIESISAEVRPKSIVPVGRYALQIHWTDGHSTGMYAFDTLHEICTRFGEAMAEKR